MITAFASLPRSVKHSSMTDKKSCIYGGRTDRQRMRFGLYYDLVSSVSNFIDLYLTKNHENYTPRNSHIYDCIHSLELDYHCAVLVTARVIPYTIHPILFPISSLFFL